MGSRDLYLELVDRNSNEYTLWSSANQWLLKVNAHRVTPHRGSYRNTATFKVGLDLIHIPTPDTTTAHQPHASYNTSLLDSRVPTPQLVLILDSIIVRLQ